MNIHLTDEKLNNELQQSALISVKVGSSLYNMENKNSDTDILNIITESEYNQYSFVWTHHQFQYKKDNVDYLYCSLKNFIRNILTGDSTINYEVLFSEEFKNDKNFKFLYDFKYNFDNYHILKSYLGFARRDLKYFKKDNDVKKLHHAVRGLWSFNQILKHEYTNDVKITDKKTYDLLLKIKNNELTCMELNEVYNNLINEIDQCRIKLNDDFNNKKIVRMMSVDNMKILDIWLMDLSHSEIYRNKQQGNKILLHDIYDSLQNDIKYEKD